MRQEPVPHLYPNEIKYNLIIRGKAAIRHHWWRYIKEIGLNEHEPYVTKQLICF